MANGNIMNEHFCFCFSFRIVIFKRNSMSLRSEVVFWNFQLKIGFGCISESSDSIKIILRSFCWKNVFRTLGRWTLDRHTWTGMFCPSTTSYLAKMYPKLIFNQNFKKDIRMPPLCLWHHSVKIAIWNVDRCKIKSYTAF